MTIELQTSDSTTGMTDAINGMSDIGMASRELKQEELDAGLVNTVIATDGIAIIVNNESPIDRPDHRAGTGHLPGQHHRLV